VPKNNNSFFKQQERRPQDISARQEDVEAILAPRRVVVQDIPVERIAPNPFQARFTFEDIEELAEAIRSLGFVTRLRVRPSPNEQGTFELVFGERRLRAAKSIGLNVVPCEVGEHTDEEMIEVGLAENIQRRDLNPLEEAHSFQRLIAQHSYTIRSLAERLGKNKNYVESRIALLRTPDDVQEMVTKRSDTIRAAREIAKLETPEERAPLIEGVLEGTLSKEKVYQEVRQRVAPKPTSSKPEPQTPPTQSQPYSEPEPVNWQTQPPQTQPYSEPEPVNWQAQRSSQPPTQPNTQPESHTDSPPANESLPTIKPMGPPPPPSPSKTSHRPPPSQPAPNSSSTLFERSSNTSSRPPGTRLRMDSVAVSNKMERDVRTIRRMFREWNEMLDDEEVEQETVFDAIGVLVREVYRLTEHIDGMGLDEMMF
jgi:ParB family chromosome partitioning protein